MLVPTKIYNSSDVRVEKNWEICTVSYKFQANKKKIYSFKYLCLLLHETATVEKSYFSDHDDEMWTKWASFVWVSFIFARVIEENMKSFSCSIVSDRLTWWHTFKKHWGGVCHHDTQKKFFQCSEIQYVVQLRLLFNDDAQKLTETVNEDSRIAQLFNRDNAKLSRFDYLMSWWQIVYICHLGSTPGICSSYFMYEKKENLKINSLISNSLNLR